MKCMIVLAVLVATVAAAPQQFYGYSPLTYSSPLTAANTVLLGASPLAYAAAPAPVALPAPLPAIAPLPAVAPAPIAYQTGARVINQYQPVEQHGYTIVY